MFGSYALNGQQCFFAPRTMIDLTQQFSLWQGFGLGRLVPLCHVIQMRFCDRQERMTAELAGFKNSQERFAHVVRRGREYAGLTPEFKVDANRLDGCLARVWLVSEFDNGRCRFRVDSDSAIVKGIAVILCEIYSGLPPDEILAGDPAFLEQVGLSQHLTPNRRDSLGKIWKRIHAFASGHAQQDRVH